MLKPVKIEVTDSSIIIEVQDDEMTINFKLLPDGSLAYEIEISKLCEIPNFLLMSESVRNVLLSNCGKFSYNSRRSVMGAIWMKMGETEV